MSISEMLEHLVAGITDIYGLSVNKVILYGSEARGTATEESDVDVALILNQKNTHEQEDKLIDLIVDLQFEINKVISVIDIDLERYMEWIDILPFYKNINKEGIVLWAA